MSFMSEFNIEQSGEVVQELHLSINHKEKCMDVRIDDCVFLGISEDIQGRDLIWLEYEGVEYEGYPFMKWTEV